MFLFGDMDFEFILFSFFIFLKGEFLSVNWIFGFEFYDLIDDIYWVIVLWDGEGEVYNYIGGVNVEDEWLRFGGEVYFFVEVKFCDIF